MLNLLKAVEEGIPCDPKFHWKKTPLPEQHDLAVIGRLGKPFFKKQVIFRFDSHE